ncbi:hypothetical protein CHS0354_015526 [Potamilus streckersoni]|uniref:FYVE-type domain-containing protein n=1 Tax=Potamilus streckersoni TaxID=2493646 RepID=A0AAE0W7W8_9BIVA|nr:hypothetical protein CHS0354_015526 [Potamilus streckersoni]
MVSLLRLPVFVYTDAHSIILLKMSSNTVEKKLVKSKSGLRMVAKNDFELSPFFLDEPPWVPDDQCEKCMQCGQKFELLKRRHHCRRCGRCFCHDCCNGLLPLPRMCFVDPVRQCSMCANITRKENDFFDTHLKVLLDGGIFVVQESNEATRPIYICKLSPDQRTLIFEGQVTAIDPILVQHIESLQILASLDALGNSAATGLAMKYRDKSGEIQVLKMSIVAGPEKKQAQNWISAFQKAFKMVYDSRVPS